jgi:hypothetical protein
MATTVADLYRQTLGREPDPGGLEYWTQMFGSTVDPTEAATFSSVAQNELASRAPAPAAASIPNDGSYRSLSGEYSVLNGEIVRQVYGEFGPQMESAGPATPQNLAAYGFVTPSGGGLNVPSPATWKDLPANTWISAGDLQTSPYAGYTEAQIANAPFVQAEALRATGYTGELYTPEGGLSPAAQAAFNNLKAQGYDVAIKAPTAFSNLKSYGLRDPSGNVTPIFDYEGVDTTGKGMIKRLAPVGLAALGGYLASSTGLFGGTSLGGATTAADLLGGSADLVPGVMGGGQFSSATVNPYVGATGAGSIAGYGGAGDVLNPATGAVITGADAATGLPVTPSLLGNALSGAARAAGGLPAALGGLAGGAGGLPSWLAPFLTGATSLAGGAMTANAQDRAAQLQAQTAANQLDLQRRIYEESMARTQPFYQTGVNALADYAAASRAGLPQFQYEGAPPPAFQFRPEQLTTDPGYGFRLKEGLKALEQSAAARGGLLSGTTGKALTRYGQEAASQEFGNAYNRAYKEYATQAAREAEMYGRALTGYEQAREREGTQFGRLGSLVGMGQSAAGTLSNLGQNYATAAGNTAAEQANALAAGRLGRTSSYVNALTGLAQGVTDYSTRQQQNALLGQYLQRFPMGGVYGA